MRPNQVSAKVRDSNQEQHGLPLNQAKTSVGRVSEKGILRKSSRPKQVEA